MKPVRAASKDSTQVAEKSDEIVDRYEKLIKHDAYIREHGVDMPEITERKWGEAFRFAKTCAGELLAKEADSF